MLLCKYVTLLKSEDIFYCTFAPLILTIAHGKNNIVNTLTVITVTLIINYN